MEATIMSGDTFVPSVFMNPKEVYLEGYRYGCRLCSFQGPPQMRVGLIPFHQWKRQ